jgi:hypothetical protein
LETKKKIEVVQPLVSFFASLKTDSCVWSVQNLSLGC